MTVEKKKERKREAYIILAIATVDGIITSRKELESKEERGKREETNFVKRYLHQSVVGLRGAQQLAVYVI